MEKRENQNGEEREETRGLLPLLSEKKELALQLERQRVGEDKCKKKSHTRKEENG